MRSFWFGDVDGDHCSPFSGNIDAYAERIGSITGIQDVYAPPDWRLAVRCGICKDRVEYIAQLRKICFALSEREIQSAASEKDAELLQMVRTLDEMDAVINVLSEKVTEWHQVKTPLFSRKYQKPENRVLVRKISESKRGAISRVAAQIEALAAARTDLAREVSARAGSVMPNTSALIGGLVAARLMATAGGLLPLCRLPASTIQVIGARTALFSHIRSQSPPPKHGIIFQHRRVHNAEKDRRGKVARVLAGKIAIAARIDYYRGEADNVFLSAAQHAIDLYGSVEKS
jgi:nucleolar protein 56